MNKLVLNKLLESFGELETAIRSARIALTKRVNPPQELLDRVENYEKILDKQRRLSTKLWEHVADSNWGEVGRHVKLINALSTMIRDDAREVVTGLRPKLTVEERDSMML